MNEDVQIQQIQAQIEKFEISQNYFSDILNAQLVIFSLIVAVIVGAYFIFQSKVSKSTIKKKVDKEIKKSEKKLAKKVDKNTEKLKESISETLSTITNNVSTTEADVYRSMAYFWDSQSSFGVAFLWWIRASHQYAQAGEDVLTRICLNKAKLSVEKIEQTYTLVPENIGEYQKLMSKIDTRKYKLEKELLDDALKKKLE